MFLLLKEDGDEIGGQEEEERFDWDEMTQGLVLAGFFYGYIFTQPKVKPQLRSQPKVKPQFRSQPKVKPKLRSQPKVKPQLRSQPKVKPQLRSQLKVKPQLISLLKVKPQFRSQPKVKPQLRSQPKIIGGRLAEVYGTRLTFGLCGVTSGFFTLLSPIAARSHYGALIAVRVLMGLFQISFFSASNLSMMLTMAITGVVIDFFGWEAAFYIPGALCLIWALCWFVLVADSPSQHPSHDPPCPPLHRHGIFRLLSDTRDHLPMHCHLQQRGHRQQCLSELTEIAPNFSGTLYGLSNTASAITMFLSPICVGAVIQGQQTLAQWRKVFWMAVPLYILPEIFYLFFCSTSVQPWNSTGEEEEVAEEEVSPLSQEEVEKDVKV
ncbi:Vesicular glutamate transporter 2 [Chionoecetes opilio]|uniref:Vesicular glutamate transporter 2 n=1 Tax=Chionoecetes opilio TaxID=41210 RepID=A0A8J4XVG9_CHIOP|nr:Vesicular glutamate transporter 2 [Chionoecetes opilio]